MRLFTGIFLVSFTILIFGCGTAKKLNRETGGFYAHPDQQNKKTSSNTFANGLKLVYERKIKGAGDSPLAIGSNWFK